MKRPGSLRQGVSWPLRGTVAWDTLARLSVLGAAVLVIWLVLSQGFPGCTPPGAVERADSLSREVSRETRIRIAQADTLARLRVRAAEEAARATTALEAAESARRRADALAGRVVRLAGSTASDSAAFWRETALGLDSQVVALREADDARQGAVTALTAQLAATAAALDLRAGQVAALEARQATLLASMAELQRAARSCTLLRPCLRVTVGPGLALAQGTVTAHAVQVNVGLSARLSL